MDSVFKMEIISDIKGNKELIESSIKKYGHSAEHYYYCYLYNIESREKPYYFRWDDDKAILAKHDTQDDEWYIFVGILAPEDEAVTLLKECLDYMFSSGAKKVWCEFTTSFRKQTLNALKDSKYKVNKVNYTLTWPVFDMKQWNGDKMEGKEWKDMRYYWNKFFKDHKVEFREYAPSDNDALKEIVKRWKKERNGADKTFDHYYLSVIENDFKGYNTRVIIVDDKICGITAGYALTNRNYYYSSIGLVVKDFDRIGEIANMDDLMTLKKHGHEIVDFGGGEKHLTTFKSKFKPTSYYKTHIFSIVKRME
jgi:hypothetical protein